MGEPAQERLIRKIDLEKFLSTVQPNPSPKASLEQYTISDRVAADILYLAAYANRDIVGKSVLDLGCGTGRLGLGAAFLGAETVTGVDVDRTALSIAYNGAKEHGLEANTNWIVGDIDTITGKFDTVLQNPPFGVQKRGADKKFLEKALEVGYSIYSLHNHPETDEHLAHKLKSSRGTLLQVRASPFIKRFVEERNGIILAVHAMLLTIPRMFEFHTKAKREIVIDLYIIKKANSL
jgi:putative methylase